MLRLFRDHGAKIRYGLRGCTLGGDLQLFKRASCGCLHPDPTSYLGGSPPPRPVAPPTPQKGSGPLLECLAVALRDLEALGIMGSVQERLIIRPIALFRSVFRLGVMHGQLC